MTTRVAIKTGDGIFFASFSERGLTQLGFPGRSRVSETETNDSSANQRSWIELTTAALKQVLAGRNPGRLPPLDWTGATEFRQATWKALLRIAPGHTKTYGQIARELGRPLAVRAVGGACGANPIPVLVPCHRVVAAGGAIGGFSGGLDWKRRLLAREGVEIK